MAYERVNWENLPSTKTPINQTNLNKMENGIDQAGAEIFVGAEEPTTGGKVWFRKGKNLFDKSKALLGYWISNEQGDIAKADNDVFITDFIPVFKDVDVYIPATGSARREFYNKNKEGITYLNNSSVQVFTPTEDGFIRVTCVTSTVTMDNLMIYYGSKAAPYEHYIEPQIFVRNSNGVYEEFTKKSEEVYSTEEQRIGIWNGKKLYRKTIEVDTSSSFTNSTLTKYEHKISNIEKIIKATSTAKTSWGGGWFTDITLAVNKFQIRADETYLYIKNDSGSDYKLEYLAVILEYTKTTD